jgi:hypothetical protein
VVLNNGGNKKKSAVILPEERGYMEEERGYIAGRARLYCRKTAVILPEERGYIFCNKNSGHLSADRWRTHSAQTNLLLCHSQIRLMLLGCFLCHLPFI